MKGFIKQLKENYLSIISLLIAVVALVHNNRLYEKAEANRNTRAASFEILMKLGQLQQEVNRLHFESYSEATVIAAWGNIALIADLSELMPAPVPEKAQTLLATWNANQPQLKESRESVETLSQDIDSMRTTIIDVIRQLH